MRIPTLTIQNPLGRLEIQDREKNAYVNVHGKIDLDDFGRVETERIRLLYV